MNMNTRLLIVLLIIGLGLIVITLSIAMVALISNYYDSTFPHEDDYAIVFDAGSSSTKMYVYSWQANPISGEKVRIYQIAKHTKYPGIDTIKAREETVFYFNESLKIARKSIPFIRRNRTLIALAATAGMRILAMTNPTQAEAVLSYIREYFSTTEFLFDNSNQVQVIDGKEEGLFAWVATNYFLDAYAPDGQPTSTYGVLDLGGASNQVAFAPTETITTNDIPASMSDYFKKVRIYGVDYNTFSASYLCWGVDQIWIVYQAYLIIQNDYSGELESSCLNPGTFLNVSIESILTSPCSNSSHFNYPRPLDINRLKERTYYIISGKHRSQEECSSEISALFPKSDQCESSSSCSFNDVYWPNHNNETFYAFAAFFFKINNTELLSKKFLRKDIHEYSRETDRLCSINYDQLTSLSRGMIMDKFLKTTCFYNHYILGLFKHYKMYDFSNIEIRQDIEGNTVGWSLGYLFSRINRDDFLPSEIPAKKLPIEFFIPAIIIASCLATFLIVGLVIFICILLVRNEY